LTLTVTEMTCFDGCCFATWSGEVFIHNQHPEKR
jgi:hypothetical protein